MNKKAQTGRFTALFILVILVLIVGSFIPALIRVFVDVSTPNLNSIVYPVANFFSTGITLTLPFLGTTNLDFFAFLPNALENYWDTSFFAFTFLPDFLSLPLFLLMAICLIYVIVTFIPTVGG